MTRPHIVPEHARRLRQCDASDIAAELLTEARTITCPLALWLLPNGEFLITASRGSDYERRLAHDGPSLVGVYSGDATKADIIADVQVRAEQIGMEWAT